MDDNGLIIEQRAIKQQYNGDAETYKRAMAEKRKQLFCWNDIYTGSVTLPEYEGLALRFITSQLAMYPVSSRWQMSPLSDMQSMSMNTAMVILINYAPNAKSIYQA